MTRQRPEQQIRELNRQLVELDRQGRHREAVAVARQVYELDRRVRGDDHPDTATSLNNLGYMLSAAGATAEARSCYERALAVRRRALGDHPDTANSLNCLGNLLQEMGHLNEARPYLEEALEINRRTLGENHPSTVTSLGNLGLLFYHMGDAAAARPYFEQALAVTRSVCGDHHPDTALRLHNLGSLLLALGDFKGARPYLDQALEIRRARSNDHPDTANSLNGLGGLLQTMGDLEGARPYFEEALAIWRRICGDEHPDTATGFNNLGWLLQALGDVTAARPLLERAVAVRRRILGDNHPSTAASLTCLAHLLEGTGDLAAARPLLEEALAICRRGVGDDHPTTARSLNNLGYLSAALGDRAAARACYEEALAVWQNVVGNDHPETAQILLNLGDLEVAEGRFEEGLALLHRSLAVEDRMIGQVFSIGSDQERLSVLQRLQSKQSGFLSLVWRHRSGSDEAVRSALDLILRRKALGAEALAAQRDAILGGRYPHLRETFDQLTQLRQRIAQRMLAGPAPGETRATHEQTLAGWLQEQQQRETALARQIPEMNLEQQQRKADRRAVALALPEGVALVEFVRFDVFDFHAVPARGERQWQPARYVAFVLPARQPDQVQMIDLGEADPIDQMIADFRAAITTPPWNRPDRGRREPSRPTTGFWGRVLGSWKRRARGQKVSAGVEDGPAGAGATSTAGMPPVGGELRRKLFDPLVQALGNHTQLWLAPDGDLTRLPFEVLPAGEPGKLLLDVYRISYLATGRDVLRHGRPPTRKPAPALVAADPDFDLSAAPATPSPSTKPASAPPRRSHDTDRAQPAARLPGTRTEGKHIAAMLGVQPVLDRVLDQPLKAVRSPRILHLATHGFFLEDQKIDPATPRRDLGAGDRPAGSRLENPLLRSGLLLAGFNTWINQGRPPEPPAPAEDGMLTAEDVTGMDLLDTELAVLSACETGLGQIHIGEGVFGLRRAFAVAGAKTLVMSLWKVPDEQTQQLMVDFYQRILKGEPRAEALRQAQQALRTRDGGRYADPYYWGAFICQGDPGPLRG
jgi:CHAT domain-containing protein/tetratricopeptide (TPR) repeat protein